MDLQKIAVECPATSTPLNCAKSWITSNDGFYHAYLLKVSKRQPQNRAHTHYTVRDYFYLFFGGRLILSNAPGQKYLWTSDSWSFMIHLTQYKRNDEKTRAKILKAQALVTGRVELL